MYTAFLTHSVGTFKGTADTDHEAVMKAYKSLKAIWSIDPWTAFVTVYNGDTLAYVCKTFTEYEQATH